MSSPLSLQRWILLRSSTSSTSLLLLRHNQQQFHYSTTATAMMVRRVSCTTQQQRQQQQRHSLFVSLPTSSRACWFTTSTRDHPVNQRVRDMKTKTKSKYGAGADEEEEEVEGSQIVASSSSSEGPSSLIKRFREEGDTGLTREPIPLHAVRENDLDEHEAMFGESLRPSNEDPCPEWQNPLHHNNPDMQRFFPEDFPGGEIPPEAYVPAPPVKDVDGSGIYAPQNVVDICNDMLQLNMLEMAALHQKICLHFGFPYDDPISGGGGMGGGGNAAAAAAPEPEAAAPAKTVFDLKLVGYDEKSKIKVIKEVRAAIPGLGLKEAKELVEGAPKVISKDMKPELAEELKKKLEEAGAIIEIV